MGFGWLYSASIGSKPVRYAKPGAEAYRGFQTGLDGIPERQRIPGAEAETAYRSSRANPTCYGIPKPMPMAYIES